MTKTDLTKIATHLLPSSMLTLACISLTFVTQGTSESPNNPLNTRGVPPAEIWLVIIAMLGAASITLSIIGNLLGHKIRRNIINRIVSTLANIPIIMVSTLGIFITISYGNIDFPEISSISLFLASTVTSGSLIFSRFKNP